MAGSALNVFTGAAQGLVEFMSKLDDDAAMQLLAMLNMDEVALESKYEGFYQFEAAAWSSEVITLLGEHDKQIPFFTKDMKEYVNAVSAVEKLKQSAKEIEAQIEQKGIAVKTYADELMNALLQLEEGKSYCMAGGWSGEPGHAMVYRFKKTSKGFDIYIYNAQGGDTVALQGGTYIEGELKERPCFYFQGVTCEELFFKKSNEQEGGNSITLQRLIELKCKNPDGNEERNVETVLALLSRFGKKLIPTEQLPKLFLGAQRSGCCTFKSINCLLLEIMSTEKADKGDIVGGNKDYKRLMLDARFLSLLAFYSKCTEHLDEQGYTHNKMLAMLAMLDKAVEIYLLKLKKI